MRLDDVRKPGLRWAGPVLQGLAAVFVVGGPVMGLAFDVVECGLEGEGQSSVLEAVGEDVVEACGGAGHDAEEA